MDALPPTQLPAPLPAPPFPFFGKLASYYARVSAWGNGLVAQVRQLQALLAEFVAKHRMAEQEIQVLRDEIARLKGLKPRPKILGSALDKRTPDEDSPADEDKPGGAGEGGTGKRPGSAKRAKTAELKIHRDVVARLPAVPADAVFKGYNDYVVQDLSISCLNTRVRRETWLQADGTMLTAPMPAEFSNGHFGVQLQAFVLVLHRQAHVSQQALHEMLLDMGVDISEGQVNAIINDGHESFMGEAADVLKTGLLVSPALTVDDTAVRHQGENGVATNISGPFFAWFCSTESKTRLNFITLLHGSSVHYAFNEDAVGYLARYGGLPFELYDRLRALQGSGDLTWLDRVLDEQGIVSQAHRLALTEAALWGGLTGKRHPALALISDGARQFVVGPHHGLCWVHTERLYLRLIPGCEEHRVRQERVRGQIWQFYAELKAYKRKPGAQAAERLSQQFDEIFRQETGFPALDAQLRRTFELKESLLLVLRRPEVPLHTNQSETDIRDYVKTRKISGGTRSDTGRRCRDAFTTLLKTCRKNGVSYWDYVKDRLTHAQHVPWLPDLVRANTVAMYA